MQEESLSQGAVLELKTTVCLGEKGRERDDVRRGRRASAARPRSPDRSEGPLSPRSRR